MKKISMGKWMGLAVWIMTEVVIVYGLILSQDNFALCASIQAGVFSAVWGIVGVQRWYDKKNGNAGKEATV